MTDTTLLKSFMTFSGPDAKFFYFNTNCFMRSIIISVLLILSSVNSFCQMDLPPSGGNPRATLTEEVGITSISIKYSKPDVNKREGKIWGELIPFGFSSLNLNTNQNNMPWRAGANENTTITFEHDVKV